MTENALQRLQRWYFEQTNGDWEHSFGVEISTLDNPGWSIKIDLTGTTLFNRYFEGVEKKNTEIDWVSCRVRDGRFEGFGGPLNLHGMICIFLHWAEDR